MDELSECREFKPKREETDEKSDCLPGQRGRSLSHCAESVADECKEDM